VQREGARTRNDAVAALVSSLKSCFDDPGHFSLSPFWRRVTEARRRVSLVLLSNLVRIASRTRARTTDRLADSSAARRR
jgi:hypothetical protein